MAVTTGGDPSAAPMPVRPASVSTRMRVASLFTFVPRSVRWRFSAGTGADIGMADTLVIFIRMLSLDSFELASGDHFGRAVNPREPHHSGPQRDTRPVYMTPP